MYCIVDLKIFRDSLPYRIKQRNVKILNLMKIKQIFTLEKKLI